MGDVRADIEGVDDLQRALEALAAALPDEFGRQMTDQARLIVRAASSRVPAQTGAARASMGVEHAPAGAQIVAGGRQAPYYGWLDFGGAVGRKDSSVRPYLPDGRYLYPATKAAFDDVVAAAERAVIAAGGGIVDG